MNNILNKFSKGEFFSVLPPGFYIFIVVYSSVMTNLGDSTKDKTLWDIFELLAKQVHQQPIFIIFILFACYMLGSIFRALPVWWAERSIPPFHSKFPYSDILKEVIDTLNSNTDATKHRKSIMPVDWKMNFQCMCSIIGKISFA